VLLNAVLLNSVSPNAVLFEAASTHQVFPEEGLRVEHGADERDADDEDRVKVAPPIRVVRLTWILNIFYSHFFKLKKVDRARERAGDLYVDFH
jgi:hypothetical protein